MRNYDIDWQRLNQLETQWQEIEAGYRLAPYQSPINLKQEKEKTLRLYQAGEAYNPQFEFASPPDYPTRQIRQFAAALNPDNSWIEQIYYDIATRELLHIQAVQTHDSNIITGLSCLNYGLPQLAMVAKAEHILANTEDALASDVPSSALELSDHEVASELQLVLDKTGLLGWQAVVSEPMNAKTAVNRLDKQVKIRMGELFDRQGVQRLIMHELGVHVIRYHNGVHQPIRLFQRGFPGYIATEEGLAVYVEEKSGLLRIDVLRKYAGRVLAAHQAISHSFSDVLNTLCRWLDPNEAFDIAARSKRGFTDTSLLGTDTKDIVYLQGYLNVKKHLEEHPEDYELLFIGKFGLQHLPILHSLLDQKILAKSQLLPEHLRGDFLNE
jgi:hypothetical protein